MALAALKISEKGKQRLLIIVTVINIIQITFGFGLVIIGISITFTIGSKLHTLDKTQFEKIFRTVTIFGVLVMIIYIVGLKVCYNCANPAMHFNPGRTLAIWLSVGLITSILGVVLAFLSPVSASTLHQQLKNSLFRGMGQYLNDPSWKKAFDKLQQGMKCCGTLSYTDWHHTSWISIDSLREDSLTVLEYAHIDGRILPPVVPWSCCNIDVRFPCFHDVLQQLRSKKLWHDQPQLILDSLYTEGCLPVILPSIQSGLSAATGISVFIFLLQITIAILARYLYTASKNSILLGNPVVTSYGWLFGRGDCGYHAGPTMQKLNEMRAERKAQKLAERRAQDNKKEEMDSRKKEKNADRGETSEEEFHQETSKLLNPEKSNYEDDSAKVKETNRKGKYFQIFKRKKSDQVNIDNKSK